jgi:hypothetical protein
VSNNVAVPIKLSIAGPILSNFVNNVSSFRSLMRKTEGYVAGDLATEFFMVLVYFVAHESFSVLTVEVFILDIC